MIVLLATWASAYELSGSTWRWHDAPIEEPFAVNVQSFPGADPEALLLAWEDALRVWNVEGGAAVELLSGGETTRTQWGSGDDGANTARYAPFDAGTALAVAARTVVGPDIIDCDILFYGSNAIGPIRWSLDPAGAPGDAQDLRQTAIHELGHCVGLDHSYVSDAIMYPSTVGGQGPDARHLHADDRQGLQVMYGAAEPMLLVADVAAGGLAPGAPAEVRVRVENAGDATAWRVVVDLRGDVVVSPPVDLGDLRAGAEEEAVFEVALGDACVARLPLSLTLTDEAGRSWSDEVELAAQCPAPRSCATTGGAPSAGGLWLVVALARRGRRRPL